jgi:hypothetical protein
VFSRRTALPDDIRAALGLGQDKPLAWGELKEGGWAAATLAKLSFIVGDAGAVRRPWSDVDRASFNPQFGELTLSWVDGSPPVKFRPIEPKKSRLPQVIRERVEWSVVLGEAVELADGKKVRIAVRRDVTGPLFAQVVADAGVDALDPDVAALIAPVKQRLLDQSGASGG